MVVRGLYTFICGKSPELLETYELQDKKLIVDGWSVSHHLLERSQSQNQQYLFGGSYRSYYQYVKNFFEKFINNKVDILIILKGAWWEQKRDRVIQQMEKDVNLEKSIDLFNDRKDTIDFAVFKEDVFLEAIKCLKIKFLICTFNSDFVIATVAKILDCPVLTANSDLFLYNINCIVFHSVTFSTKKNYTNSNINCKIYRPEKLGLKYKGFNTTCLPLVAILLGRDYLTEDVIQDFMKPELRSKFRSKYHAIIDTTFIYLSGHTLSSGAEEIVSLMSTFNKSLALPNNCQLLIEEDIGLYFSMSTYMLHRIKKLLNIDEAQILKMKDKFFKFKFDSQSGLLRDDVEENNDIIRKNFEEIVPEWFLFYYFMGKLNSSVINLVKDCTFIAFHKLENFNYPSVYEISLPLISLIYRLAISCTDVAEIKPLQIIIRQNINVVCKNIDVEIYPLKLQDIRKSDVLSRLKIINNALNIDKAETLQDIPKNWQLYVATAVFWFKQTDTPVKNNNHLNALLLAMFFDIIDKKIKDLKCYNVFRGRFCRRIEKIRSQKKPELSSDRLPLMEAIRALTYEDALITADYLLSMSENQEHSFDNSNELSITTIHIFSQFQCCLEQSKNLNTLLGFPYFDTIISEVFHGSLIYNLFIDFSTHSADMDYIAHKLKDAPSVLMSFTIFSEKVHALL